MPLRYCMPTTSRLLEGALLTSGPRFASRQPFALFLEKINAIRLATALRHPVPMSIRDIRVRFAFYLLIKFVTSFGFTATNVAIATTNSDTAIADHALRVSGSLLVWFLMAVDIAAHLRQVRSRSGAILLLAGMYIFLIAAYPFAVDQFVLGNYLEIVFRGSEWLQVIALSCVIVSESGNFSSRVSGEDVGIFAVKAMAISVIVVGSAVLLLLPKVGFFLNSRGFQLGGSFIHPNRLAVVGAVSGMAFALFGKKRWETAASAVCLAIGVLSGSRAGLLINFIAAAAILYSHVGKSMRPYVSGFAAFGLVGGLIALNYRILPEFSANAGSEILSLNSRTYLWQLSASMFGEHPLLGWGYIDGPRRLGAMLGQGWWTAGNAQNDVASAAVSGGSIGLLLLICFYASVAASLKPDGTKKGIFLVAAVICFAVTSFFEPLLVHVQTHVAILLVLVTRIMLVRSGRISAQRRQPRTVSRPSSARLPTRGQEALG